MRLGEGGNIEYKCRRCGVVESNVSTPNAMMSLIDLIIHGKVKHAQGVPVNMLTHHTCEDGGAGIADCIGVVPWKEDRNG